MSEEINQQLAEEIERIKGLPLEEQPSAFEQLRLRLEALLNSSDSEQQ